MQISPESLSSGQRKKMNLIVLLAFIEIIKMKHTTMNVMFLDEIFSKVLIHLPDFKYSQIKLKFNSSRVYTNLQHSAMNYWIETEINNLVKKYDNDNNANS
jgi:hypothetical protein